MDTEKNVFTALRTSMPDDHPYRPDPHSVLESATGIETERIDGRTAVRRRLDALGASAAQELLVIAYPPVMASLGDVMMRRGVRLRVIVPDEFRTDPSDCGRARSLAEAGCAVRLATAPPISLVIVDQAEAWVSAPADSAVAVIHRHPSTVFALASLFAVLWRSADGEVGMAKADLAPGERRLLRLFANGAKDETAARQLGVSVRSVRRCVAGLMARHDLSSRFELAVRAGAEGWIAPASTDTTD